MGNNLGLLYVIKMGGKPQKDFVWNKEKDLGLLAIEKDHNCSRVPAKIFGSRNQFLIMVNEGLKQMETKTTYFSGTLQCKVDTNHRSLCILSLPSTSLLHFLETWLVQLRQECISSPENRSRGMTFHLSVKQGKSWGKPKWTRPKYWW